MKSISIKTLSIAAAIVAATSLVLSGCAGTSAPTATSTPTPSSDSAQTALEKDAVIRSATLQGVSQECETDAAGLLVLKDNFHLGVNPKSTKKLNNSFAFNVPVAGKTASKQFKTWQQANCDEILQGVAYAWRLANTKLYGVYVGNISGNNFKYFKGLVGLSVKKVSAYAKKYFEPPTLTKHSSKAQKEAYITASFTYQTFIQKVNSLYAQMENRGDGNLTATNWQLAGPSGGYPQVEQNPKTENKRELTLAFVQKGVCRPVAAILINLLDQRPEQLTTKAQLAQFAGCSTQPRAVTHQSPKCVPTTANHDCSSVVGCVKTTKPNKPGNWKWNSSKCDWTKIPCGCNTKNPPGTTPGPVDTPEPRQTPTPSPSPSQSAPPATHSQTPTNPGQPGTPTN